MRLVFVNVTYEKPGGAENLIFELIKIAHFEKKMTSIVIGSRKSYVVKRLIESQIPFLFFNQDNNNFGKIETTIDDLIINTHNYEGLQKLKNIKGKAIIWGLLVSAVIGWNRVEMPTNLPGKGTIGRFLTRCLLVRMSRKDSLISIDGVTSNGIAKFLGKDLKLPIVPIPIDASDQRVPKSCQPSDDMVLRISYIGRSDDLWKILPIRKIVQDLSNTKTGKFLINIYTDAAEPFNKTLNVSVTENISIRYHFGLYGVELRNHLSANSDLHFSMGTAALEGGLAGVATVVVDPSTSDLPVNYKYRWLYETKEHSLGRFINPDETHFIGMTMTEIIETCFQKGKLFENAVACSKYVIENHSALFVLEKLLSVPARATMKDVCRFAGPRVSSKKNQI